MAISNSQDPLRPNRIDDGGARIDALDQFPSETGISQPTPEPPPAAVATAQPSASPTALVAS